jgi:hypothetical protein
MAPSLSGLSNNLMLTKLKKNQNKKKIRTKRVNLKKKNINFKKNEKKQSNLKANLINLI